MATFTLDDIRAAAEAQYGSLDIPISDTKTVSLINPLRHTGARRKKLSDLQDRINAEQESGDGSIDTMEPLVDQLIVTAAATDADGEALLAVLNDLAEKMAVLEKYGSGTQVGEASSSQD